MVNLVTKSSLSITFLLGALFHTPTFAADEMVANRVSQAPNPSGKENEAEIFLRVENSCYFVSFDHRPSEVIACSKQLPLRYTRRNCQTKEVEEHADVNAVVSCQDSKNIALRFRTSDGGVLAQLRVRRNSEGRAGITTQYKVENASRESGSLLDLLPVPLIHSVGERSPEESPLQFKASGFAWIEHDRSTNYGYDTGAGTQIAQQNFNSNASQSDQQNTNLFTNLSFELFKDRTSLVSTFEIGEIYFGDSASGGGQGTRAGNIFEVRNLYLSYEHSEQLIVRGGLITLSSDPRSFIYNDHTASLQATFKTDLTDGTIWYGNAQQHRPGAPRAQDAYLGLSGNYKLFFGISGTAYYVFRKKRGENYAVEDRTTTNAYVSAEGSSHYHWLGTTLAYSGDSPIHLELTGIGNWIRSRAAAFEKNYFAYLLDGKVSYTLGAFRISAEGLLTPGGKDLTDASTGQTILDRRKSFISPIGASYLLSIATSDGADDAPGAPRQSTLASLSQNEGLKVGVLTLSADLNKRTNAYVRYGKLSSRAPASPNRGTDMGQELDVGGLYQITPSTILQLDYGRFYPGDFFAKRDTATLFAARVKYNF